MSSFLLLFQKSVEPLQRLFDKYVAKSLDFRRKNCKELVPTGELNAVTSLCYLLDSLATPENGVRQAECSSQATMSLVLGSLHGPGTTEARQAVALGWWLLLSNSCADIMAFAHVTWLTEAGGQLTRSNLLSTFVLEASLVPRRPPPTNGLGARLAAAGNVTLPHVGLHSKVS